MYSAAIENHSTVNSCLGLNHSTGQVVAQGSSCSSKVNNGQRHAFCAGLKCLERFHYNCSVLSWLQQRLALSCRIADPLRDRLLRTPR